MAQDDDKRQHERYPVSYQVETSTTAGTQGGALVDISAGGAAIVGSAPLAIAVGEPVELRVENFEKLPGHVVRANGGTGFAIAFDGGPDAAVDLVRGLVGGDGGAA